MFHTKDIGTKHLDYNIRLTFGKTKFKDQLANFAVTKTFVATVSLMTIEKQRRLFYMAGTPVPTSTTLFTTYPWYGH